MLSFFDGERFIESGKEAEKRYTTVIVMKPKASRGASSEMYFRLPRQAHPGASLTAS